MPRRIAILIGHPDPAGNRLTHALAAAYAEGARESGHEVRIVDIARLDFPLVRGKEEWDNAPPPPDIAAAQEALRWCEHLLILFPLWLGAMPALLKAFLEQCLRPGFAVTRTEPGMPFRKLLSGRSARIVVTMGMPAAVYRWYYRAHSLKSLERNILEFCGIGPIRETLLGLVETGAPKRQRKWLAQMRELGRQGK